MVTEKIELQDKKFALLWIAKQLGSTKSIHNKPQVFEVLFNRVRPDHDII